MLEKYINSNVMKGCTDQEAIVEETCTDASVLPVVEILAWRLDADSPAVLLRALESGAVCVH